MKKIFTFIAAAAFAMAANAQYTEFDTSKLTDTAADVAAGTVMGTAANGIVATTGFADQCKIVGVTASKFSVMNIAGTEFSLSGGYQGNNNAKDADGGNPANTLLPAASGSVLVLDVPTSVPEGVVYVIGKFSQNKQYVVTEDNQFIGYTIICDGTAAGQAKALVAEVKGDDATGYFRTTPIDKLGDINGAGSGSANNGVGFIKFNVFGGSKYMVHATGSKLTQCGFFFSTTGDEQIVISGEGDEAPAPITLQGTTGISTVKAANNAANAVVYNLAGQKVGADFKGIVVKNGVKMIQK